MNHPTALRSISAIAVLLVVLVVLMYRDLSEARKLIGPPARIDWNGLSIGVPDGFVLKTWPAFGYPAYSVKTKRAEKVRDTLYFATDPSFAGSSVPKMLTMEQCREMSKYCVAVVTQQQTALNPFCRAAVLRGDKGEPTYELSVQFEFDDSGTALTYVGDPDGIVAYVDLIDGAIKEYGKRHGMAWTSGKECEKQVLQAAIEAKPDVARERPRRKPTVD